MGPIRRVWDSRFWGIWAVILLTCVTITSVTASVQSLAPEVDAHVFYVKSKKELLPVVGVESKSKVLVLFPDKSKKPIPYKQVSVAEKKIRPAGRVTVCGSEGRTEWEQYASADFISTTGTTYFTFDLVADRFIPNCYVALIMQFPDRPNNKAISFSKLGDLPAGELVKKDVVFYNIIAPEGSSYEFEFYMGGMPIEQFRLSSVSGNPRSQSLLIPWDLRLKQFLKSVEQRNLTMQVRPFRRSFTKLDPSALKGRGIKEFKITILVKKDGTVALKKGDPQLTENEQSLLSQDVQGWQFLPAVKDGKPYDLQVSVPLKL